MKNTVKKLSILASVLMLVVGAFFAGPAAAACKAEKKPAEMTHEDLRVFYDCIRPGLVKGYQKKGKNPIAMGYTDWQAASTAPAATPGMHSGQYLMTYVNPLGYAEYVAFKTAGADMPVGTLIAKENFSFKKNGKLKKGALLMMEKVGLETRRTPAAGCTPGSSPTAKNSK